MREGFYEYKEVQVSDFFFIIIGNSEDGDPVIETTTRALSQLPFFFFHHTFGKLVDFFYRFISNALFKVEDFLPFAVAAKAEGKTSSPVFEAVGSRNLNTSQYFQQGYTGCGFDCAYHD